MKDSVLVRQSWKYGTYQGAEESRKEVWRQLSWREKLLWLEQARRFIAELKSRRMPKKNRK